MGFAKRISKIKKGEKQKMIYNLKKMKKEEERKNRNYKQLKEENERLKVELEISKGFYAHDLIVITNVVKSIDKILNELLNDYDFVKAQEKKILLNRLKQN